MVKLLHTVANVFDSSTHFLYLENKKDYGKGSEDQIDWAANARCEAIHC